MLIALYIGDCNCGTLNASQCVAPMIIRNGSFEVDGMFIGCLPLSSLLQSSLSCFYNTNCFQQFQKILNLESVVPSLNISVLNKTVVSHFTPETPLKNIMDDLMIEDWSFQLDYLSYFHQCNVESCTYTYVQRNDIVSIFSRLLGVCKYQSFVNKNSNINDIYS